MSTRTSNFGVSRREGHDSSSFYARFVPPEITRDETVVRWVPENSFICGDSSTMDAIPDNSVALIVTSPPYFVGKEYEEALGEGDVPATYFDYLTMLLRVFSECKKKLEPGGRIAVNVANLGRRPYRSLSSDIVQILQDDLKLMLRGEVVWAKAKGMSGSCAWGSFRQATNPVLRDITERVIIASKGRFDRAKSVKQRKKCDLPYESTITTDEFMEGTLDLWDIASESATRIGHPAPFPVELPQRLIELYTFREDVVLDPFMGSGSTLVAAARTGRAYIGYDLDERYVAIAQERVQAEQSHCGCAQTSFFSGCTCESRKLPGNSFTSSADYQSLASREGKTAQGIAENVLSEAGFAIISRNAHVRSLGVVTSFVARDLTGSVWHFDVSGSFTTRRAGLLRTDTLWKALGRVLVLASGDVDRLVLLTSHLPQRKSAGDLALRAAGQEKIFDAVEILSDSGQERLKKYATGRYDKPLPGFWTPIELQRSSVNGKD